MRNIRTLARKRDNHLLWLIRFVSLVLIALTWTGASFASAAEPDQGNAMSFLLNSKKPFGAVHISFTMDDTQIVLKVRVNGKPLDCILDTGVGSTFEWVASSGIKGRPTGYPALALDVAGGFHFGREVMLSTLTLGGYELHNLPGYEMQNHVSENSADAVPEQRSVLGNGAFAQVVLTIDYQKHELLLRRPDYDFRRLPGHPTDMIYPFWLAHEYDPFVNPAGNLGVPVLRCTMQGLPLNMEMDTGCAGPEIGLTALYLKANQSALKWTEPQKIRTKTTIIPFFSGPAEMDRISEATFFLGSSQSVAVERPALILPLLQAGVDGLFGYDILQHLRVTLDYPRKMMLLEPYQPDFKAALLHYVPAPVDAGVATEAGFVLIVGGVKYCIKAGSKVTIDGDRVTVDGKILSPPHQK